MKELPLRLQGRPFTIKQAAQSGVSFYELGKLVASGAIEQVARGIYRSASNDFNDEEQFRIATLRVGKPSAICLISALAHYHLTDVIPKKTWIMVPSRKRTSDRALRIFRARTPHWNRGVEKFEGYAITTLERTLVDCLTHRTRLGTQVGIEALRRAISSKKTTLGKVMQMAKDLGVSHRILPYIEALS